MKSYSSEKSRALTFAAFAAGLLIFPSKGQAQTPPIYVGEAVDVSAKVLGLPIISLVDSGRLPASGGAFRRNCLAPKYPACSASICSARAPRVPTIK